MTLKEDLPQVRPAFSVFLMQPWQGCEWQVGVDG